MRNVTHFHCYTNQETWSIRTNYSVSCIILKKLRHRFGTVETYKSLRNLAKKRLILEFSVISNNLLLILLIIANNLFISQKSGTKRNDLWCTLSTVT